jgi:hypothetical protein
VDLTCSLCQLPIDEGAEIITPRYGVICYECAMKGLREISVEIEALLNTMYIQLKV